jgi:membrane associated rhomboid family serine protease
LELIPPLVLRGQVWRLITYIFIPEGSSPIWIIFILYLYYVIGNSLENEWGSFKFNIYYLLGMLGTTIAAFITGAATATYLNMSLFLAFAYLFPNYELLIFFAIPVKVKYLGWLIWIYIGVTVLTASSISLKVAALASVLNFLVFFGKEVFASTKLSRKVYDNR